MEAQREAPDVVVIGSGIGGLTAAALLGRVFGKRVLVLERHWELGGLLHEFARSGGYRWSSGLHYVGEVATRDVPAAVMRFVTGRRVAWQPLPQRFDRFVYPDFEFAVPDDPRKYEAELAARFPTERDALRRYFRDVARARHWYLAQTFVPALLPAWLAWPLRSRVWPGRRLALTTTGAYLNRRFRDPRLRALLASQWGDYGVPPATSAFAMHALVVSHYFRGASRPVGGSGAIARAVVAEIEAAGGACRTRTEVVQIGVEQGRVTGVRIRDAAGERFVPAPVVVSAAGAFATFRRLLDPPRHPELDAHVGTFGPLVLFLALKEPPAAFGWDGGNRWLFAHLDHDAAAAARDTVHWGFLSAGDDVTAPTATFIGAIDAAVFAPWKDRPWRARGADYDALKDRLRDAMLAFVGARVPGLRERIVRAELGSPLTVASFTGRPGEMMYGVPGTPARFALDCLRARTGIRGLFLAGADVVGPGVFGAMMGGVAAAGQAGGAFGPMRVLGAVIRADRRENGAEPPLADGPGLA